jgi:hypothetical protein
MIRVCLAALFCLSLISCEDKEDDKIFGAQTCLDHATAATVDACVAMIAGINTNRAYIIRCSADFKRNGIDATTIVQAIEDLDNANVNSSETLYKKLVFGGAGSPNQTLADQAVDNCAATGSQVLLTLAQTASTATTLQVIANALGGGDIANLDPNAMTDQQLIDVAEQMLDLYPTACTTGGPLASSDACKDMEEAATAAHVDLSQPLTDAQKKDLAKQFVPKI